MSMSIKLPVGYCIIGLGFSKNASGSGVLTTYGYGYGLAVL